MTNRDRLIKILSVPIYPHVDADPTEVVADYLLENDVVPVVRCKDCVFCNYNSLNDTHKCSSMNGMHRRVEANEFCSYGERKDND